MQRSAIEAFVAAARKKLAVATVEDRMHMIGNMFRTAARDKRRTSPVGSRRVAVGVLVDQVEVDLALGDHLPHALDGSGALV
ncbi:hypothetical protein ACWC2T_30045 [Streptomyces sp. NPDC001393]